MRHHLTQLSSWCTVGRSSSLPVHVAALQKFCILPIVGCFWNQEPVSFIHWLLAIFFGKPYKHMGKMGCKSILCWVSDQSGTHRGYRGSHPAWWGPSKVGCWRPFAHVLVQSQKSVPICVHGSWMQTEVAYGLPGLLDNPIHLLMFGGCKRDVDS